MKHSSFIFFYLAFIGLQQCVIMPCYGKLVFIPGSDMGYILPDGELDNDEDRPSISSDPINLLEADAIKKESKRAFMNTIFDDFAGTNEWERLQSQMHPIKDDQRIGTLPHNENDDLPEYLHDSKHGVAMGISSEQCDDAKSMLEVDWDGSPTSFTCYTPKSRLEILNDLKPVEICYDVPADYIPQHYCMKDIITYNSSLPTHGPHRPLWPVFGEYTYVPPQRWLHSIEHGSIVMLYHPCTEPILVMNLKKIIRSCIYKHIISASNEVSLERPLVLIAWGCKLELSYVDEAQVKDFIKKRALHGPEGRLPKQGQYTEELLIRATPPEGSNINDINLCPQA